MHRFWKVERAQRGRENLGQDIDGRLPALMPAIAEIGSLRRLDPLDLRHVDVVLFGKAQRGIGRPAGRVKRRGDRGAHEQFLEIRLPLRNFRDARRQPSRCAVALDRRVRGKPKRAQGVVQTVADLPGQIGQPRRRHFFGADFQEQFTFHLLSRGPRPEGLKSCTTAARLQPHTPAQWQSQSDGRAIRMRSVPSRRHCRWHRGC